MPWDAFDGEKRIRATLEKAYPELKFGFYFWNGHWIVGALEDFDHHRILLLLPCADRGSSRFVRNGQKLNLPPGDPVTFRVAGALATPEGTVNSPEHAYETRIGYWITLEAVDQFEMSVDLFFPCKGVFHATYDPNDGWQTSCKFEIADQERRKPADAYEITRDSLLKRVLEVLRTKDECIVRLQSNQGYRVNITLRKWRPRDANENEPSELALTDTLELALTDKIVLGVEEGRREVTPRELEQDLDMYGRAAMAARARADVRMSIHDGTDDKVFRATLNTLAQEMLLGSVYLVVDPQNSDGPGNTQPNKTQ